MSTPLGFHITLRLEGDRNLAPTDAHRRIFARTVLSVARPFVVLTFRWADTHGHLEMLGSREEAGELARRVQVALQHALRPGVPFQPAHFTAMLTLGHVKSTFGYILGQRAHHGLVIDPFDDGSNAPDLIGARTIGVGTAAHVRRHLTRIKREHILEMIGRSVDPDRQIVTSLNHLDDAAAAAVGLVALDHGAGATAARIASIHLAGDADVALVLGRSDRTIRRLRKRTVDPAVARAVRQQLAMRSTHVVVDPLATSVIGAASPSTVS